MSMRVGQGYDVHCLIEGRPLILGGVSVPFEKGLEGHSDADVLTHAIIDALLGAAGMGDIGTRFPDDDARFKNISSLHLLADTHTLLMKAKFEIVNIDATIVAQRPKLSAYKNEMACNIARVLQIDRVAVNVKATTEEGLGFTGAGRGIAAQAVCLLKKTDGES